MSKERINRLNSDINILEKGVSFANEKVDEVISKIFDTDNQVYIVEGDVRIRQEFNTIINLINIALEENRIQGDKITLDGDVYATEDFSLEGNAYIGGVIQSYNWGLSTGGELDLINGTLKFGGCSSPKFSIDALGNISAKSGTAAGFDIDVTEGFYAGEGDTRVQMKPGAGIWAGATAIADAPFSATNAGVFKALNATIVGSITANTGYIGGASGWTIASKTLTGAADSKIISGILQSSDWGTDAGSQLNLVNKTLTFGGSSSYKFKIDSSGNITAKGGAIGGWTIGANKISITGIDIDQANSRIKVYTGSNYVEMKPAGLFGYDSVLGTTVKIPTNGDAPEFSKGIIKEFIYEIYTSGVIRTNANPAVNGGMLINNATMTGYAPASGGARFFVDYAGSNPGDVKIGDYANSKGLFWDQSEGIFNVKGIFTVKGGTIEDTLTMGASGKIDLGSGSELTKNHLYLTQSADIITLGQNTEDHISLNLIATMNGTDDALLIWKKGGTPQVNMGIYNITSAFYINLTNDITYVYINGGYLSVTGYINAVGGFKDNGVAGIDTTFLDADGNTITSSGGIITSKVAP